jgi:cytochrome b561
MHAHAALAPDYQYGQVKLTPPSPAQKVPGSRTKWLHLTFYILMFVLPIAGLVGMSVFWDDVRGTDSRETFQLSMFALMGAGYLSMFGQMIAALVWIYKSWNAIPDGYRVGADGKHYSPGGAIGMMFIPFFNLYWMFVMPIALCDAIDRINGQNGAPVRAPRGLAIAAAVCQLIPYVNFLIAPLMWFLFMRAADRAKSYLAVSAAPSW